MIPLALAMSDAPDRPEDAKHDPGDATPFRPSASEHDGDDDEADALPEPELFSSADALDEESEFDEEPDLTSLPDPALDHELESVPESNPLHPESEHAEPGPIDIDYEEEADVVETGTVEWFEPEPAPHEEGVRAVSPPPPTPPPAPPSQRPPLQRAALALLLIAAAGMIGYALSTTNERPDEPDALTRSVEAAGNLRLLLRTDVPAEAQQFIREEFGWRVGVPLFEAVSLTGVAIAQAAAAVEVPVFLYADDDDQNVAVFAYSYALLDQVPDRLRLTTDDYEGLAEGVPAVRETDLGDVLLWRDRDDIYVAVTDLPPADLINGLSMNR